MDTGDACSPPPPPPPSWEQLRTDGVRAWDAGDYPPAETALLAALARAEREAPGPGASAEAKTRLVQSLSDLGSFYASQGSPALADRLLMRSLRAVGAESAAGPAGPLAAHVQTKLSELRCRPRGFEQAEALARRALEICRRHPLLGPNHVQTARALAALGHSLAGRKKLDDAEAAFQEALAVCGRAAGVPARVCWLLLADMADLRRDRGRHREALGLYRTALQLREQSLAAHHPEVIAGLAALAAAHERLGEHEEARPLCERVVAELERRAVPDDLTLAEALHRLARACARDDAGRARDLLGRALLIEEKRFGPDHPALERTLRGLASIAERQGHPSHAMQLRERIVALRERCPGEPGPNLLRAVTELSHAHCREGQWREAEALDQRALYLAEKIRGFEHPTVARVLDHYAQVLRRLGRDDRAGQLDERAVAIRRKFEPPPGRRAPG